MGLQDVIGDFAEEGQQGSFLVTRRKTVGNGYDVNGYGVDDATSQFPIDAAVFPVFPRDLMVLEEGQRSEDSRTVFTETPLIGRNKSNAPDVILIDAESFVVWSVRDWHDPDGHFYQAICARSPAGGGP
jgi:hypothetical protein